ncbi:MAG: sulfite exporter TauE/SafE family protein [Negativicutes bacterium]|nr:sulfite exporter TauE/SafE family protein [Negativicutes bacterium]
MQQNTKFILVGFVVGILSGLLGLGGGVFLIPVMVTCFAVAQHNAHATSLAVVVPTAVVSATSYAFHGFIDFGTTLNVIIGSIIGASFGARLAKKIPAAQLKRLFGLFLVCVGARMMFS